jgi:predicted transcriptional regulator
VNRPYLLAREPSAVPIQSPRSRAYRPQLKPSDPAVRAMNDFLQDPPSTVPEDADLEEIVDHMFCLGVRAFLVVHDRSVIGLITAEDASDARRVSRQAGSGAAGNAGMLRAADVMTPSLDVPAIDWQTLQESRISDLMEIFEGTGVRYLVVLQTETATWSTVRGLIHRQRLERQLIRR